MENSYANSMELKLYGNLRLIDCTPWDDGSLGDGSFFLEKRLAWFFGKKKLWTQQVVSMHCAMLRPNQLKLFCQVKPIALIPNGVTSVNP